MFLFGIDYFHMLGQSPLSHKTTSTDTPVHEFNVSVVLGLITMYFQLITFQLQIDFARFETCYSDLNHKLVI